MQSEMEMWKIERMTILFSISVCEKLSCTQMYLGPVIVVPLAHYYLIFDLRPRHIAAKRVALHIVTKKRGR